MTGGASFRRRLCRGIGMTTQRVLFRYMDLPSRQSRAKSDGAKKKAKAVAASFPSLHDLVDKAWTKFPTVGQRHVPPLTAGDQDDDSDSAGARQGALGLKPVDGTRYIVPLRRSVHQKSGAVILRMCVYTQGEVSAFAPQELEAAEAEINYTRVTDGKGHSLPPGIEFSVLLLGRVALIQNRAGAGAARAVQRLVHFFGRQICGPKFVTPRFMAVSPRDLRDQIDSSGGIAAVSFGLLEVEEEPGEGIHLADVHEIEERVGGSRTRVRISAESDQSLDEDESIKLLEDPEEDGLEDVRLHLRDGGTLTGQKVALGKTISVSLENGVPSCKDVDKELLRYLNELMRVDKSGDQKVTADGRIGGKLAIMQIAAKRS